MPMRYFQSFSKDLGSESYPFVEQLCVYFHFCPYHICNFCGVCALGPGNWYSWVLNPWLVHSWQISCNETITFWVWLSHKLMKQKAQIYFKGLSHIRKKSEIVIFPFDSFLKGQLYSQLEMCAWPRYWWCLVTVNNHFRIKKRLISLKSVQQPLTWPNIREANGKQGSTHCLLPIFSNSSIFFSDSHEKNGLCLSFYSILDYFTYSVCGNEKKSCICS